MPVSSVKNASSNQTPGARVRLLTSAPKLAPPSKLLYVVWNTIPNFDRPISSPSSESTGTA